MEFETVKEAKRYAGMKVVTVLAGLAIVGVAPVAEADFLIIFRSGKEIQVNRYEEQGDQIIYKRYGGKITIPKAHVATIKDLSKVDKQPPDRPSTAREPKVAPPEPRAAARTSPAEPQGSAQEVARCADEANGRGSLRDFLPAAGSIATYKGTVVRRERSPEGFMDYLYDRLLGKETTSTFEGTVSHDWRSGKGGEYYITTFEEREKVLLKGSEALQLTERATEYEVTCNQLARRSYRGKTSGPRGQSESVSSYDPPEIRLLWPLTKGSMEQSYRRNSQPKGGTPRTAGIGCTIIFKGEETIHTPAGDFRAWRVEKGCSIGLYRTTWWAKGIGVVKWQANLHTPSMSQSGELVDFKQPDPAHTPSR